MAKPASYTIVETVRGDGSSFFRVHVGRWRRLKWDWIIVQGRRNYKWTTHLSFLEYGDGFTTLNEAQDAARDHWNQHLHDDVSLVVHREHHFDPEGPQ